MTPAPLLSEIATTIAYRISPDDTVALAVLAGPRTSGSSTTVCLEIWDPLGSQPDNSHPESTETFVVLSGNGRAHSDEHCVELRPGSVIVLPKGSVHRIENTSSSEKLYTLTVMEHDGGFEEVILRGTPLALTEADLSVLAQR